MKRRTFLSTALCAPVLALALPAHAKRPQTTVYQTGIYTADTFTIPAGETWQAAPGARVIFTRPNGQPPTVFNFGTARNLWFGGARETEQAANLNCENDTAFDGCTFVGYYGGVNVGEAKRVGLTHNRFVNCGGDLYYHPVYVANPNAQQGEGATIEDNIFVGGEGYPIHLYHAPNWNSVRRNFVGGGMRCIAVEGHHNTVRDNVFWSNTDQACAWVANENGCSDLLFNHNLFGAATTGHYLDYPADSIVKNNWFVGDAFPFGTSPKQVLKSEVPGIIGITHNQVQAAVSALKFSFTLNTNLLLSDATIEPNFTLLKGAVTEWVG